MRRDDDIMLDGYIIDAILKEEQRRRQHEEARPRLDLPLPPANEGRHPEPLDDPQDAERGVVIIPLRPGEDSDAA